MGKPKFLALPLQPVVVERSFEQWGLDFIGEFKDNFSSRFKWILTCIDYFTIWVEDISTKKDTFQIVYKFP